MGRGQMRIKRQIRRKPVIGGSKQKLCYVSILARKVDKDREVYIFGQGFMVQERGKVSGKHMLISQRKSTFASIVCWSESYVVRITVEVSSGVIPFELKVRSGSKSLKEWEESEEFKETKEL